ncbi:zinc finger protein 510-like [Oppia nitens]|uniref:zinc finger protein 510-like n=1 Tax=Oppia nitens TaxID=1686743 RepID=UPI0023DAF36B|nr:zinc finger protein 510-like [Oppia nitens]
MMITDEVRREVNYCLELIELLTNWRNTTRRVVNECQCHHNGSEDKLSVRQLDIKLTEVYDEERLNQIRHLIGYLSGHYTVKTERFTADDSVGINNEQEFINGIKQVEAILYGNDDIDKDNSDDYDDNTDVNSDNGNQLSNDINTDLLMDTIINRDNITDISSNKESDKSNTVTNSKTRNNLKTKTSTKFNTNDSNVSRFKKRTNVMDMITVITSNTINKSFLKKTRNHTPKITKSKTVAKGLTKLNPKIRRETLNVSQRRCRDNRKYLSAEQLRDGVRDNRWEVLADEESNLISVLRKKPNDMDLPVDGKISTNGTVGYKCNECQFVTGRRTDMKGHVRAVHYKQRPFLCNDCNKGFTFKRILDSHRANIHGIGIGNKDRPARFKCQYPNCTYETHYKSQFESHGQRHRKERNHRCDECEAAFCAASDLKVHKRRVHDGSRPYICSWPGCDAAFKSARDCRNHGVVHSSERPFTCDAIGCGMSFKDKSHLKRHMDTHESIKRHRCIWPACERSFSRKHHLDNHMKTHTCGEQMMTQSFMVT